MTKISFLIAFVSLAVCAHAQDFPEFDKLHYTTSANTLLYRLLKPSVQNENERYPLVIFLHGSAERGNDNVVT